MAIREWEARRIVGRSGRRGPRPNPATPRPPSVSGGQAPHARPSFLLLGYTPAVSALSTSARPPFQLLAPPFLLFAAPSPLLSFFDLLLELALELPLLLTPLFDAVGCLVGPLKDGTKHVFEVASFCVSPFLLPPGFRGVKRKFQAELAGGKVPILPAWK